MEKEKLDRLIKKKNGYITTEDAELEGIHREYLSIYVEEEKLIRTAHGMYQSPEVWDDFLYTFQHKKKRVIYSHETALFFHGLSDRYPITHSVTVPSGYNTSQIKVENLTTYTIKADLFDLGKTFAKTPFGNDIYIYDLERTICDIVRSRNKIDKEVFQSALKRYVQSRDKNLVKLVEYAKLLKILSIVKGYLEILL